MIWICTREASAPRVLPVFNGVFLIFGGRLMARNPAESQQNLTEDKDYVQNTTKTAIIMVYVGHSILYYPPGLFAECVWSQYLRNMILSCNMPVFFMISGLLLGLSKKSNIEVAKAKIKKLLIPYLVTMAIVVVGKFFMPASMAMNPLNGGVGDIFMDVFVYGGDRWFVYVLMWIFLLAIPLRPLASSKILLVIISGLFLMSMSVEFPRYFLMGDVFWFMGFFLIGMYLNPFFVDFRKWNTKYALGIILTFVVLNIVFVIQLISIPIMRKVVLPITGSICILTISYLIDDACKKLGYEPKVVKYIAYCGRYSLQFYLFTFAYPVIRTIVVNTLHVTSPFLIFSLVLIMQLVIMTLIVELTRNVKILKIPMGY